MFLTDNSYMEQDRLRTTDQRDKTQCTVTLMMSPPGLFVLGDILCTCLCLQIPQKGCKYRLGTCYIEPPNWHPLPRSTYLRGKVDTCLSSLLRHCCCKFRQNIVDMQSYLPFQLRGCRFLQGKLGKTLMSSTLHWDCRCQQGI